MTVSEYLVDCLINNGITDVFGIPGGVILSFLYALDARSEITPHLSYHEQAAAFEACGYAQSEHNLGAAYATRGPGFTNLITGIADAYSDSIPVLFITAHSGRMIGHSQRFERDQELDTVSMVKHITKYAKAVETLDDVVPKIATAISIAMSDRKGPVLLDFSAGLWNKDLPEIKIIKPDIIKNQQLESIDVIELYKTINESNRPIVLVGDGVRQAGANTELFDFLTRLNIPVISSRCGQDVASQYEHYYGYIGSHGIRYANFIFAKADLVIAIGNRLSFPVESESFQQALVGKRFVRIDIDGTELQKYIPGTRSIHCNLKKYLELCLKQDKDIKKFLKWIKLCDLLKQSLRNCDTNRIVNILYKCFSSLPEETVMVSDVGNNEFWVSRAYELSGIHNRVLYSKSFGALGCGIGKAIGAYYALRKPVLCLIGDQGFQLNIQELQFIAQEKIPIALIVINNQCSGMIENREKQLYKNHLVHTTRETGYFALNIEKIAIAYGLDYRDITDTENLKIVINQPTIYNLMIDEDIDLQPSLPKGNPCQKMFPELDSEFFENLDSM